MKGAEGGKSMQKTFSLLGVGLILVVVGFLESPMNSNNNGVASFQPDVTQETIEVSAQGQQKTAPSFSSLEYILEETKEVNGYIVETYREYELYEDKNGDTVKRVPTSNYDYIRYKDY
jgi:hypothetical protein